MEYLTIRDLFDRYTCQLLLVRPTQFIGFPKRTLPTYSIFKRTFDQIIVSTSTNNIVLLNRNFDARDSSCKIIAILTRASVNFALTFTSQLPIRARDLTQTYFNETSNIHAYGNFYCCVVVSSCGGGIRQRSLSDDGNAVVSTLGYRDPGFKSRRPESDFSFHDI